MSVLAVRSGFAALVARGLRIGLDIGTIMILARLLTPADFGLIAMVLPVTLLAGSVAHLGLQPAVLHVGRLSQPLLSSLFWLSLKLNGVVYAGLALSGPLLAWLYGDSRVTAIAVVWAASLYGLSTAGLHEALLQRQLRFGTVVSAQTGSQAVAVAAAIAAALLGAGYWALVVRIVIGDWLRGAAIWALSGWRPTRRGRPTTEVAREVREMLSYGMGFSGYRLVSWFGQQMDRLLIGTLAGAGVLGLYHNARRWAFFPFSEVFIPLREVAVSTLSRVRDEPVRYRRYCRRGLLPLLAIPLPATAFMFVSAQDVIVFLLGGQWLGAVPFFRLMCIASFFGAIGQVSNWIYLTEGTTARQFKWALVRTPVVLAAIGIGFRWGAYGVAVGFSAATALMAYPTLAYCLNTSVLRMRDVLGAAWRPAVSSAGAASALSVVVHALPAFDALPGSLLLKLAVFGVAYLALWTALPGGRHALKEVLSTATALWPSEPLASASDSSEAGSRSDLMRRRR